MHQTLRACFSLTCRVGLEAWVCLRRAAARVATPGRGGHITASPYINEVVSTILMTCGVRGESYGGVLVVEDADLSWGEGVVEEHGVIKLA